MMAQFEDYCLWMYVVIDELWPGVAARYRRSGPSPACSDSELVTMVLVGESRGWDEETDLVREWRARRDLFPIVPERSRFNRRRRLLRLPLRVATACGDGSSVYGWRIRPLRAGQDRSYHDGDGKSQPEHEQSPSMQQACCTNVHHELPFLHRA